MGGAWRQVLGGFGKDIDSHDTVMRYNTPIKGYEEHVGTKTALLWSKSKYSGSRPPTLGYVFSKVAGQSPLYMPIISGLRTFRDQIYRMWFQASAPSQIPRGPRRRFQA